MGVRAAAVLRTPCIDGFEHLVVSICLRVRVDQVEVGLQREDSLDLLRGPDPVGLSGFVHSRVQVVRLFSCAGRFGWALLGTLALGVGVLRGDLVQKGRTTACQTCQPATRVSGVGQIRLQLGVVLGVVVVGLRLHLPGLAEQLRTQGIGEVGLHVGGGIRHHQVQELIGIHHRGDQVGPFSCQAQVQNLDL